MRVRVAMTLCDCTVLNSVSEWPLFGRRELKLARWLHKHSNLTQNRVAYLWFKSCSVGRIQGMESSPMSVATEYLSRGQARPAACQVTSDHHIFCYRIEISRPLGHCDRCLKTALRHPDGHVVHLRVAWFSNLPTNANLHLRTYF